ncbi:MAG TPA: LysM peptidoglycan-binding domain-containing protein [Streptosporangiaceae bacterium]
MPRNRPVEIANADRGPALSGRRPPERPRSSGVRLTRRGRVVLIVLAALILLGGLWLTAGRGALAGSKGGRDARTGVPPAAQTQGLRSVVVGSHDTLWEIAARARPDVDPRITVRRIIDLNSLSTPIVQPGQRLLLPK